MESYKLSLNAKEDLRRIYTYGFVEFGELQADKYFEGFFQTFEKIASNPNNEYIFFCNSVKIFL